MEAANLPTTTAPVLVVDVLELARYLRERMGDAEALGAAYTESFSYKKSDLALNVGGAVAASRLVINGDCRGVCGWSVKETTNAAGASIVLHDGGNAAGEVIVNINLATNESTRDWVPPHGIRCFTGRVFLEVVSGSVAGVVYWR